MTSRRTRGLGVAFTAASLAALTGCGLSLQSLPLPGGADLGSNPMEITAEFSDVLDLVPQSSVKLGDITVGRVTEVDLQGYTALVTLEVRGDVDLPDNANADIRQTSLLGEKFVSLSSPEVGASSGRLSDGDRISLAKTGASTELEAVFSALSLVLNEGGLTKLQTITKELNQALGGREAETKSALRELSVFMGQLDNNKNAIVDALARVNQLSVSLNAQEDTLDLALDNIPQTLESLDRQRDDLVRVLTALNNLSDVAVRVIRDSKQDTVTSLRALAPTLRQLANAGRSLPLSLQVGLTYPFIDAVVGRNPQQARDFQFGDYTNLSVLLDIDLSGSGTGSLPLPRSTTGRGGQTAAPSVPNLQLPRVPELQLPGVRLPGVRNPLAGGSTPNADSGSGTACSVLGVLCRVSPTATPRQGTGLSVSETDKPVDPTLSALMTWGLVQ